jgi:hypothetical protein
LQICDARYPDVARYPAILLKMDRHVTRCERDFAVLGPAGSHVGPTYAVRELRLRRKPRNRRNTLTA